jgi:hypothetical protein
MFEVKRSGGNESMKVKEFNLLLMKRQTKVRVVYENDLFKVGEILTVKDIDKYMSESIAEIMPNNPKNTKIESKRRFTFIDGYKKKIINSLEKK